MLQYTKIWKRMWLSLIPCENDAFSIAVAFTSSNERSYLPILLGLIIYLYWKTSLTFDRLCEQQCNKPNCIICPHKFPGSCENLGSNYQMICDCRSKSTYTGKSEQNYINEDKRMKNCSRDEHSIWKQIKQSCLKNV